MYKFYTHAANSLETGALFNCTEATHENESCTISSLLHK